MQTTVKLYTDIDYESFPIADLDLDLHWIQLPNSVLAERRAKLEAQERERIAALPKDHKVILIPTDPTYSPIEEELWPLVNHTVQQCLRPTRSSAPPSTPLSSRPWPNTAAGATPSPPTSITHPNPTPPAQNNNSRYEPGDLVKNNHFKPPAPRAGFAR